MEKYYKRKLEDSPILMAENDNSTKSSKIDFNPEELPTDPGLRIPILDYHPNIRDLVRLAYVQKGPCQPKEHNFPLTKFGKQSRRFNRAWFSEFANWLEYSIAKDAVFCLCCYLFKPNIGEQAGGDSFVGKGFTNFKKGEKIHQHVGGLNSAHNQAWKKFEALKNQKQHLEPFLTRQTEKVHSDYRTRLTASVDCIRFLLRQGLPFRGDDESETSSNRVDESRDISMKEQMAVILRYVDKNGHVIERFVGIEHVASTTALSLKEAIDKLFSRHGLSVSRLRGQGYDGASNMQAVAKKHIQVASLFTSIASIIKVVGGSSKRCDILREKQEAIISKAIKDGEISTGRGLNQETTLKRPGDTRWGSHYGTLLSMINMFSSVIDVLEIIADDGTNSEQRVEANNLLEMMLSFDFIFTLHLMRSLLGVTDELSKALQRKDQDIVNAIGLVKICKQRLQMMRENGWDSFLNQVFNFCRKHNIDVPNMEDTFVARGRSRRKVQEITNMHHFRVELFYAVIDIQLQELNDRFNEVNSILLLCVACLSPKNSFSAYDKEKLIEMANYYPKDFSATELMRLDDQLELYIIDVVSDEKFLGLKGIGDLAEKMVQTGKYNVYPLVYRLLTLALLLPVVTATVERVFSAMNIVKTRLRNRMGDKLMNDALLVYIEKDIFNNIDNETIMKQFQGMKIRRGLL